MTTETVEPVVAPKTPKSFDDLRKPELVAAAEAFGTETEGSVKDIKADLLENGVTWEMYAKEFKLVEEKPTPDPNVITSTQVNPPRQEVEEITAAVAEPVEVVTAPQHAVLAPTDKYLIKMTRKNPYFEFRQHKFTQENPYAIMTASDAQAILSTEDGFRQAFPAELEEFYS